MCALMLAVFAAGPVDDVKPLGPVEARKKVGETITVKMTVKHAKDRLEKRGVIYLDSEADFKDEKNFAVVITKAGAAELTKAGLEKIADHFQDKTIIATGKVILVEEMPRIQVDKADQIKLAKD